MCVQFKTQFTLSTCKAGTFNFEPYYFEYFKEKIKKCDKFKKKCTLI